MRSSSGNWFIDFRGWSGERASKMGMVREQCVLVNRNEGEKHSLFNGRRLGYAACRALAYRILVMMRVQQQPWPEGTSTDG